MDNKIKDKLIQLLWDWDIIKESDKVSQSDIEELISQIDYIYKERG